jgi:coenzyme F420-0:L-glutamate ligase/coenzyme F420-1:gamma-L-glutamate ligase
LSIARGTETSARFEAIALEDFPLVRKGDDITGLILDALLRAGLTLQAFDILVVAQKVVSKAEGRLLHLSRLTPSPRAAELAEQTGKPPQLVEAILRESGEVLKAKHGVIVVEHRSGHVLANAGIDQSNSESADPQTAVLLPEDADASAEAIRKRIFEVFGGPIGVIVCDSIGRAWRLGTVGHAIGAAGLPSVIDRRGMPDLNGRPLEITISGFADAVAAAAVLLMGEGDEGRPVVIIRGLKWTAADQPAKALIRPITEDMFR